jgi:hypothetical protein
VVRRQFQKVDWSGHDGRFLPGANMVGAGSCSTTSSRMTGGHLVRRVMAPANETTNVRIWLGRDPSVCS